MFAWIGLGMVAMQKHQFTPAISHFDAALAGVRRLEDPALGSFCAGLALSYLGALAYAQQALPLATSHFQAALVEQRAIDDHWGMGNSLVRWGYVARDHGDIAQATTLFAEGLALIAEFGDRRIIALALDGIAGLASTGEHAEAGLAARLFGAAAALRESSGLPVDPACRGALERDTAAARAALEETCVRGRVGRGRDDVPGGRDCHGDHTHRLGSRARCHQFARPPQTLDVLTPREREILRLLTQGLKRS